MNPTRPPTLDYVSPRPTKSQKDWVYGLMVVGVVLLCLLGIMLVMFGVIALIITPWKSDVCAGLGGLLLLSFGLVCIAPSVSLVRTHFRKRAKRRYSANDKCLTRRPTPRLSAHVS